VDNCAQGTLVPKKRQQPLTAAIFMSTKPRIRMWQGLWKCGVTDMDAYTAKTPEIAYKAWAYVNKPKVDALPQHMLRAFVKRKQLPKWLKTELMMIFGDRNG
jgi:hypothetical protein